MTYRMIVKTQSADHCGKARNTTEQVRHIPESKIDAAREHARKSAPLGSTRTIKVVPES